MSKNYKLYWGILHYHIRSKYCHKLDKFSMHDLEEMVPHVDNLYRFVIKDQKFDFCAYADHHNMGDMINFGYRDDSPWKIVSDKADQYNKEGKFVALKGYEFQDGMEYNVYLHKTNKLPMAKTWKDLIRQVKPNEKGIILAAHNRPCPTNWDFQKHPNFRLIEILNDGGMPFERWANLGLRRGHMGGFIGGSDDHSEMPGRNSCTGVWARSLSSDDIWDALWHRRTIAATGIRPEIMFYMGNSAMGSEIAEPDKREFTIFHSYNKKPLIVMLIKNGLLMWQMKIEARNFVKKVKDNTSGFAGPMDYYYAKFYYPDGNIAYTSPIWIRNRQIKRKVLNKKCPRVKIVKKNTNVNDIGERIGYHRFINAGSLISQRPKLRISQASRDMVIHVGPDAILVTKKQSIIAPTMDGLFEFSINGKKKELYRFKEEDYRFLVTSLIEINGSLIACGYYDDNHVLKTIKGKRIIKEDSILPIKTYLYEDRYVTPQYLVSDGVFLYLLAERELVVMLPNGGIIGTCQEEYPSFPCALAADSLANVYVLSCDAKLVAYDMTVSQGMVKWTAKVPKHCCSLCFNGKDIWVYNEKIEKLAPKDTKIYVYSRTGELQGLFQPDLMNIRGASIASFKNKSFVAIHNPETNASAIVRDKLNLKGVLRVFS